MTKISIIIPVYNVEKFISRCLDSLINQTMKDIEIIVIDDKSKDNSLSILKTYKELYPEKIRVVENAQNIGAGATRNRGLELASGDYISFIDSDDYIDLDMLEQLYRACEEHGAQLARANRRIYYKKSELNFLGRNGNIKEKTIINPKSQLAFLSFAYPCVTNKLFRRDLIGEKKFPEDLKWEDYPFCLPLIYKANRIICIPNSKYNYTLNTAGTTASDLIKLPTRLLDIFTCSDQMKSEILDLAPEGSEALEKRLNLVATQNCLQRARDVLYSNISVEDKKELLSLISALISKKYGSWQENELYQEYKKSKILYYGQMEIIEKLFVDRSFESMPKEEIESGISKILIKNNQ